jgi:hypothetical protein
MERHDAALAGLANRAIGHVTSMSEARQWMTEETRLIEEATAVFEWYGQIYVRQKLKLAGEIPVNDGKPLGRQHCVFAE